MSKLSNSALGFIRQLVAPHNMRPLGVLRVTDETGSGDYTVTIASTTISLSDGTTTYSVDYVGKTSFHVATEPKNTQFPVSVSAEADVADMKADELIASGSIIPTDFDVRDRSKGGNGCLIRIKRWAASYKSTTSVNVRPPYRNGPSLPWWGRVQAGDFWHKHKGVSYKFGVPEYSSQAWSAKYGRPFRDMDGEPARFDGKSKIRLARKPVLWRDNIVLQAGSTSKTFSSAVIKDVDSINGIVYLEPGANLPNNVIVSYTYLEDTYEYKHINLNGHFSQNPYVLDKYIVYYARPVDSTNGTHRSRGVFHEVGESLEDAIHSIKEESLDEPVVLLGAFNTVAISDDRDVSITDTRSYGGGLAENDLGRRMEEQHLQSQYFFDISRKEGIPYPGSASVVVELPPELKEALSVAELQRRAKKYLAAGVYPIFKYKEEDYYSQFVPLTGYNVDLSLFNTTIEAAYSGANTSVFGGTTEVAYWWDSQTELPVPFEQTAVSGWSASDLPSSATVNTGETQDYVEFGDGSKYTQKYLKGPADAVFSWEERAANGQWERRTARDTRDVDVDHLIGGEVCIDSTLGYTEVRNFYAFSPVPAPDSTLWDRFATASSKIIKRIDRAVDDVIGAPTGAFTDIRVNKTSDNSYVYPGEVAAMCEPIIEHHNVLTGLNFWGDISILSGVAKYAYNSTTQDNTTTGDFPYTWDADGDSYSAQSDTAYDAARDLHLFARAATQLMNDYALNTTGSRQPSLYYPEASAWIAGSGDVGASQAYTGALQVYRAMTTGRLTGLSSEAGSDIISPYHMPASNAEVVVGFGTASGDIYNDMYHEHARTTKAIAALYATFPLPMTGQAILGVPYADLPKEDIKSLALSGIGHRLESFSGHLAPYYTGAELSTTWLNQYDRYDEYAGNVLSDLADAIDYLVYGNVEWAGAINTSTKTAPFWHNLGNNDTAYLYDLDFQTGEITRVVAGTVTTPYTYLGELIDDYESIIGSIETGITTVSKRGGLMTPGHAKMVNALGWLPLHGLRGDALFNGDYASLETSFFTSAQEYIKSSISNDGKFSQEGSLGWQPAPFTGEIPSEIFDICATAIEIKQLRGDVNGEDQWSAMAGGLLANTTGQYELAGGYPMGTVYSAATALSGEPGAVPLHGYLSVLGRKPSEFTDAEVRAITGSI